LSSLDSVNVYLEDGTRKWSFININISNDLSLTQSWLGHIYTLDISNNKDSLTYLQVKDADNNTILFEWRV
jgi:hypothetical protein